MAKRVPPLSAAQVARLKPDPSRVVELVDGAVPGLRLRLTPAGTRTWSLNVRSRGVMRRFDVGSDLGLADARRKGEELRRQIREGRDPTAEKRALRHRSMAAANGIGTLGAIIDAYFSNGPGAALKTKQEQLKRIRSVFGRHLGQPGLDLRPADLQLTIDAHRATTSAARATAYLTPALGWAEKRGLVAQPFNLEKPLSARAEQRTLSAGELATLLPSWNDAYGRCCRFLLLTGVRLNEALSATWEQIDLEGQFWTIPGDQMKDTRAIAKRRVAPKQSLVIPLSNQSCTLLKEVQKSELLRRRLSDPDATVDEYDKVFLTERGGNLTNFDRWLKTNARATGICGWSAHALRRTSATFAAELGAAPHIISVVLGHANIGSQLLAGYNKSRYRREHADIMQKLGDYVEALSEGRPSITALKVA